LVIAKALATIVPPVVALIKYLISVLDPNNLI
jgi:hypothetical protein